jgi:prolyl-tRNA synthetase
MAPADAELSSHQLLLRAGMIRPLGTGIFTILPLGWRVMSKIQEILRQEMTAIGGQELLMPVVQPAEVWQASGRWETVDETLLRFRDRTGRDLVLAMTHEEAVADLLPREIDSYRRLPVMLYHIQTKFRDERRPRGGLIRVREFMMKDAYSLHRDIEDLDAYYPTMLAAYRRVFRRCGLDPLQVEADSGVMGGSASHEYVLLHSRGEDEVAVCDVCGYAANAESARSVKPEYPQLPPQALVEVATPGCTSIQEVAQRVGVPISQTLKAVFYTSTTGDPQLVFALIRGDLEVNEAKLSRVLGGHTLRKATEDEIEAVGAVPGYASPIGLRETQSSVRAVVIVADDSVQAGSSYVTGANREGFHVTGANPGRDFAPDLVADIARVQAGDLCARCDGEERGRLELAHGIELGHCFKLGTRYTEPAGITYLAPSGEEKPIVMGSYGIGIGRLMAAVVEAHHDEYGICWPASVAPYAVHLVSLVRVAEQVAQADALYRRLAEAGISVLYDDRKDSSAGVKFNDADLIGCPLRLTVGQRGLKVSSVETKLRSNDKREMVPLDDIIAYARDQLQ